MKPRHHLYFDAALTAELEALARKPGASKSAIVSDALRAYLRRRATHEIDDLFKHRLDRISREIGKLRRDLDVQLESFALFVLYQLTITAPLPEADAAARAVGRDRFNAFVARVGRQVATGKRTLGGDEDAEAGR